MIATPWVATIVVVGYANDDGATTAAFTAMVTVAVVDPPLFDAVTVYAVDGVTTVGAPVIAPVEVFKVMPVGKDGLTLNVRPVPVTVAVSGVMVEPTDTVMLEAL